MRGTRAMCWRNTPKMWHTVCHMGEQRPWHTVCRMGDRRTGTRCAMRRLCVGYAAMLQSRGVVTQNLWTVAYPDGVSGRWVQAYPSGPDAGAATICSPHVGQ